MKVLVDTSIWSLVLRRGTPETSATASEFYNLVQTYRVQIVGPIRQEILSGLKHQSQFDRLQQRLSGFPDVPLETEDYVTAAKYYNQCRGQGIQGSHIDFLICAVASRRHFSIFTTDRDFHYYASSLPIILHQPL